MKDGLYYLEDSYSVNTPTLGLKCNVSSLPVREQIMIWHYRLGQPSFAYLKHLFPNLFYKLSHENFQCDVCCFSKSHRSPYHSKTYRSSKPFYLIHSDVWGPCKVPTLTDKRWFVTFIDDHTRLCWIYLMNKKSDVKKLFKDFYTLIENQFQTKINILRTDNGKGFFNQYLGNFLIEKGIQHQSTCPYTPQQNSVSERKNRHLLEVSRALMLSMNVPKYLWGEAVLTAAYLINRVPSRVLNHQTLLNFFKNWFPENWLTTNLPLKVFGCTMFVHVPNISRSKLDARAEKCVFIGYAPNTRGYKCFNPVTKKIHITMDGFFVNKLIFFY